MTSAWTLRAVGSPGGMVADVVELRRGLRIIADPTAGCEVVALTSGRYACLPGSDLAGLCAAVEGMPSGIGVYVRANPVPANLNRQTKNGEVIKRRWVYLDIDPVKENGHENDPSTSAEKERCSRVTERLFVKLSDADWPAPIVTDSGNGYALLYRIDLPNDTHWKAVLGRLMKVLSDEFTGPDGVVDRHVHNANRLIKLPGTWAKKGIESEGRPYRKCWIVSEPANLCIVPPELIKKIAGVEMVPQPSANGTQAPTSGFILRAGQSGKGAYGRAALDRECARVSLARPPADGGEGRNNTLNRAAFSLAQLVAGGELERNEVENRLTLAAIAAGLDGPEIGSTIRSGMTAGMRSPRTAPPLPGTQPATGAFEKWQPPKETEQKSPVIYKLRELLTMELPEPKWAVPGLLSEGLTMLCGKPKLGKSWMALNLAMTIAAGGLALGKIRVQPAYVLYLALEDRLRRIQDRARKVMKGLGSEANDRLQFAVDWPRQDQLGVSFLAEWAQTITQMEQQPALIVVDVWAKFRAPTNSRGNAYEQDYNQLSEVKSMGDHFGTSVLAVHHTRKSVAEDVFDEVSGTQGIAGAADGTLILARSRGQTDGTLAMTGRDIEEQTLAVSFDVNTFCWTSHGSAEEKVTGEIQKKIIAYLQARGTALFIADIAAHVERTPDQIRPILHRMFDKRIVSRVGNAWAYPAEPSDWAP